MKKNIGKKFTKCVLSSLLISALLASATIPVFAVREGEGTNPNNEDQTTEQQLVAPPADAYLPLNTPLTLPEFMNAVGNLLFNDCREVTLLPPIVIRHNHHPS